MSAAEIRNSSSPHSQPTLAQHTHMRSRPPEPLLTVSEPAEIPNSSDKTVYGRIKDGSLRAIRMGGVSRIHPQDLQDYIRDHRIH